MKYTTAEIIEVFGKKEGAKTIKALQYAKEFHKQMRKVEEISKKRIPEFIGTQWDIERHNVPNEFNGAKSEIITITIEMKSNGNTSSMSNAYIIEQVRNKLNSIL